MLHICAWPTPYVIAYIILSYVVICIYNMELLIVYFQLTAGILTDTEHCTLLRYIAGVCGSTSINGHLKLCRYVFSADKHHYFRYDPAIYWNCIKDRQHARVYLKNKVDIGTMSNKCIYSYLLH